MRSYNERTKSLAGSPAWPSLPAHHFEKLTSTRRLCVSAADSATSVPDLAGRLGLHRQGVQRIAASARERRRRAANCLRRTGMWSRRSAVCEVGDNVDEQDARRLRPCASYSSPGTIDLRSRHSARNCGTTWARSWPSCRCRSARQPLRKQSSDRLGVSTKPSCETDIESINLPKRPIPTVADRAVGQPWFMPPGPHVRISVDVAVHSWSRAASRASSGERPRSLISTRTVAATRSRNRPAHRRPSQPA